MERDPGDIGHIIKKLRVEARVSVRRLARESGMPVSHLEWTEQGRRVPSAGDLLRMAPLLGVSELDLLTMAGYFPRPRHTPPAKPVNGRLDPHVVAVLSQHSIEVQRAVINVFLVLEYMARQMPHEDVGEAAVCRSVAPAGQPVLAGR